MLTKVRDALNLEKKRMYQTGVDSRFLFEGDQSVKYVFSIVIDRKRDDQMKI